MPLINLQTNLKSFKYGHDRPGGGSSKEPFIQNDINNPSRIIRDNNIQDGFIRGGFSGAIRSSVTDLRRITKYLTTAPQGPLFILRQVGLQLSNPKLETKQLSTSRSGVIGAIVNVANRIVNAVGPTRIYNLGLNTLAQVPVNAFGTHFNRHGLLPIQNQDTKYEAVVRNNAGLFNNSIDDALKSNRLLLLFDKLEIGQDQRGITSLRLRNQIFRGQQQIRRQTINVFNKTQRGAAQLLRNLPTAGATTSRPLASGRTFPAFPPLGSASLGGRLNVSTPKLNFLRSAITKLSTKTLIIDRYLGGPGSVYGIGQTTIKRYEFTGQPPFQSLPVEYAGLTRDANNGPTPIKIGETTDYYISNLISSLLGKNDFDLSSSINPNVSNLSSTVPFNSTTPKNIPVNYFGSLGISKQYFGTGQGLTGSGIDPTNATQKPLFLDQATYAGGSFNANGILTPTVYNLSPPTLSPLNFTPFNIPLANATYAAYQQIVKNKRFTQQPTDITISQGGIPIPTNQFDIFATGSNSRTLSTREYSTTPLPDGRIAYKNSYNDVTVVKTTSWNKVSREVRIGSGRKDKINLTPIFENKNYFGSDKATIGNKDYNIRDLCRFRIQAVNTDSPDKGNWMVFRAYLTNLSDDSSAEWSNIKYAGRGENFYIYTGFTRKINISFKVATLSVSEMKFVYNKLNYLMSNTMPDYNNKIMRGPLIRMSVGNWIDAQLGILNSIDFKIPQDSPWEINLDGPEGGTQRLVLPHVVEVTMQFTPIGSESKGANRLSQKGLTISNIAQNNTGNLITQYVD